MISPDKAQNFFQMGLLAVSFVMTGKQHQEQHSPAPLERDIMGGPDRIIAQEIGPHIPQHAQIFPAPTEAPNHGKLLQGQRYEPSFIRGSYHQPVGIQGTPVR
jgi:hypothetical protein